DARNQSRIRHRLPDRHPRPGDRARGRAHPAPRTRSPANGRHRRNGPCPRSLTRSPAPGARSPVIIKLAWRFLFARGRMATLLAVVALGGLALGVLVLTSVLAVMSGFETVLSHKLVALAAEITVSPPPAATGGWKPLASRLER